MKVSLRLNIGESESKLKTLAKKHGFKQGEDFRILKKSLDARNKRDIHWQYTVEFGAGLKTLAPFTRAKKTGRVLVVGAGPAGLFCALYLLRAGMQVTLIERGERVENRGKTVGEFFLGGGLNGESNVQFGEGGAGAFSDGKLNTQVNSELIMRVLGDFVQFGAPEEIAYLNKPHVGSDRLPGVVRNIREHIISLGGEVRFCEKLLDVTLADGRVKGVKTTSGGEWDEIVLAPGHSARDTFKMLVGRGVAAEVKPFAVGVRIEHPQSVINTSQYGENGNLLPPADYKLVSHAGERAVFTFCMCPGGVVVPAASEEGGVVTNGMSNYLRDGVNANSAVIAQVSPKDYGEGVLDGVYFQQRLERSAFVAGGENYSAPACTYGDLTRRSGYRTLGNFVAPTYSRGVTPYPLNKILGEELSDAIVTGIADMGRRLKNFDDGGALLTGVETRTSSPIRLIRGEKLCSPSAENLYPCGEGAGYAGGICSAAADGIRIARAIAVKYGAEE